jgi:hypothetical protein
MALVLLEVVDELADAPAGEGLPERLGAGLGRRDDEHLVLNRDPAGTATRPPGVQARHPHLVEAVDHLADPIRRGLHQPGDRLDAIATSRGEHDHRTAPLHDRLVALAPAAANDPLKLTTLLVTKATHPKSLLSHAPTVTDQAAQVVDTTPPTMVVKALAA